MWFWKHVECLTSFSRRCWFNLFSVEITYPNVSINTFKRIIVQLVDEGEIMREWEPFGNENVFQTWLGRLFCKIVRFFYFLAFYAPKLCAHKKDILCSKKLQLYFENRKKISAINWTSLLFFVVIRRWLDQTEPC